MIENWWRAYCFNKITIMQIFFIKVPKTITVVHSNNKKLLIISKFWIKKMLKLKLQTILIQWTRILKISSITFSYISKNFKKQLKSLKNTTVSLIKQMLIETDVLLYKQLKLIGIGYWVFNINNLKKKLLLFKIGYSHFLYFKTIFNINVFSFKTIELFIYSHSYQTVTQTAALIRQFKKPEPYKNKGISYKNEILNLKAIKKVH